MTAPETPSSSPLTPEERAQFERVARSLAANPSGLDGYGGWAIGFLRALALADSLAARVSDLEAERSRLLGEGLERLGQLRAAAQEVRRAWDENADHVRLCPGGVGGKCDCWVSTVGAAIDALCPPVTEDKNEPPGREPGHPVYGWQTE